MKQTQTASMVDPGSRGTTCSSVARVIDLFSGVGGFTLGALRAGFNVGAAVENDLRVGRAFKTNLPECLLIAEDIEHLTARDIEREIPAVATRTDGVIGGPPCQGFSHIGRRRVDDARNSLFGHFFRIVSELRPRFFVAENVEGILADKYAGYREDALAWVKDYEILEPLVLKSSDFGAPTERCRVFFVGYLEGALEPLSAEDFSPPQRADSMTVGMALRGLPTRISPNWQAAESGWRKLSWMGEGWFWDRIYGAIPFGVGDPDAIRRLQERKEVSGCMGTRHTEAVAKRFDMLKEGQVDKPSRARRLERRGLCPTIRSGTGPEHGSHQAVRPIHPTQPRVITPREAARLQGFPDWFQFDETKWHSFRQIGNSVSPILAESVLEIFKARLHSKGSNHGEQGDR